MDFKNIKSFIVINLNTYNKKHFIIKYYSTKHY